MYIIDNKVMDFLYSEIWNNQRLLLYLCVYGSRLYGTNTEESDLDIKGVYLPSSKEIILQNVTNNLTFKTNELKNIHNTKNDIDVEIFSIFEFMKLCKQGQTLALEMLNAPSNKIYYIDNIFKDIFLENKNMFYTKRMKSFIKYALTQANKYSNKADRISILYNIYNSMLKFDGNTKLEDIWYMFNESKYIRFRTELDTDKVKHVDVCGKILCSSTTIDYSIKIIKKQIDSYGDRCLGTLKTNNKDYAAFSHTLRIIDELIEIYNTSKIKYPLKDCELYKKIKKGKIEYNDVISMIDNKINIIDDLIKVSDFPECVDIDKLDDLLYKHLIEIMR